MTVQEATQGPDPAPQAVTASLSRAAIFLVVTIKPGADNDAAVRSICSDLAALVRAVGFRDIEAALSCVVGIGSQAWDRVFGRPRPLELHPFREIHAGARHAVSTQTFTFRLLTTEAAVALAPPKDAKRG